MKLEMKFKLFIKFVATKVAQIITYANMNLNDLFKFETGFLLFQNRESYIPDVVHWLPCIVATTKV